THFVPPTVLSNPQLAARLGVTEEWILDRTGIRERRIADSGGTSDLIVPAAEECLRRAGLTAAHVDCLPVATITPDHLTPPRPAPGGVCHPPLGAPDRRGFRLLRRFLRLPLRPGHRGAVHRVWGGPPRARLWGGSHALHHRPGRPPHRCPPRGRRWRRPGGAG